MGDAVAWRDIKYQEIFDEELRGLERRRAADPGCGLPELEGVLRHLYIMDGADWVGRGDVQDVTMAATIAAYEHFIAAWKADASGGETIKARSGAEAASEE